MSKTKFKTKLSRKQRRKNILVLIGVFLGSYIFIIFFNLFVIGMDTKYSTLSEILLMNLALTFVLVPLLMAPMLIATSVIGFQKGKARRVRDDSTFINTQGIEYYRENLRELNPSLVSLLIDLDIYGEKDIAATLLRMQNKKIISFQENDYAIDIHESNQDIGDDELELLSMIKDNKLNDKNRFYLWRQHRFSDAEKKGYIKKKKTMKNTIEPIHAILGMISFIIAIVLWKNFLFSGLIDELDTVLDLIVIEVILLAINALLCWPMYFLCKNAGYKRRSDIVWERTPLGNETAEKIAGLSRFIHEFSSLSQAKKEEVVLWDDYLVYALILEENEEIVKNISHYYNENLHKFDKLQKLSQ